jgi:hypothetical protein
MDNSCQKEDRQEPLTNNCPMQRSMSNCPLAERKLQRDNTGVLPYGTGKAEIARSPTMNAA